MSPVPRSRAGLQDDLDPAVLFAAFRRGVGGDRIGIGPAFGDQISRIVRSAPEHLAHRRARAEDSSKPDGKRSVRTGWLSV